MIAPTKIKNVTVDIHIQILKCDTYTGLPQETWPARNGYDQQVIDVWFFLGFWPTVTNSSLSNEALQILAWQTSDEMVNPAENKKVIPDKHCQIPKCDTHTSLPHERWPARNGDPQVIDAHKKCK